MRKIFTIIAVLALIAAPAFANLTDAAENRVLDTEFTGTHYLALFSTACSDSAAGTELTGNGYARQSFTFASAASGAKASNSGITFTASGGDWTEFTHYGIYSAASGGNYKACGPVNSPTTVVDGGTYTVTSGNLVVNLD